MSILKTIRVFSMQVLEICLQNHQFLFRNILLQIFLKNPRTFSYFVRKSQNDIYVGSSGKYLKKFEGGPLKNNV